MPQKIDSSYIPKPIVFLIFGATGVSKTSVPLRSKGALGPVYVADAEKQAHLATGPAYDSFYSDPVNNASEAIKHILAAGNPATRAAYGNPKTLVIDTITVLKESAENSVDDNKSKQGQAWSMADWTVAKRPMKKLAEVIQNNAGNFDFVFVIARQKPEMIGEGNNQKMTGNYLPDVIKGFDYVPNVLIEIKEVGKLIIKKTKPSIEHLFPMGQTLTFEKFYEACTKAITARAADIKPLPVNAGWVPEVLNFVKLLEGSEKRTYVQICEAAAEIWGPRILPETLKEIAGKKYTRPSDLPNDYDNAIIHFADSINELLKQSEAPGKK